VTAASTSSLVVVVHDIKPTARNYATMVSLAQPRRPAWWQKSHTVMQRPFWFYYDTDPTTHTCLVLCHSFSRISLFLLSFSFFYFVMFF
jgi:hypothetical protein